MTLNFAQSMTHIDSLNNNEFKQQVDANISKISILTGFISLTMRMSCLQLANNI